MFLFLLFFYLFLCTLFFSFFLLLLLLLLFLLLPLLFLALRDQRPALFTSVFLFVRPFLFFFSLFSFSFLFSFHSALFTFVSPCSQAFLLLLRPRVLPIRSLTWGTNARIPTLSTSDPLHPLPQLLTNRPPSKERTKVSEKKNGGFRDQDDSWFLTFKNCSRGDD